METLKYECNFLLKNTGFEIVSYVAQDLEGQEADIENVSVSDVPLFNNARLTSRDVEQSFYLIIMVLNTIMYCFSYNAASYIKKSAEARCDSYSKSTHVFHALFTVCHTVRSLSLIHI